MHAHPWARGSGGNLASLVATNRQKDTWAKKATTDLTFIFFLGKTIRYGILLREGPAQKYRQWTRVYMSIRTPECL